MKIHKMEIKECERFPNSLSFDFTNEEGKPYPEIIFAGENGVGKTVILNLISQALRWDELNQQKKDNRNFIGAKYNLTISFTQKEAKFFLASGSGLLQTIFKDRGSNNKELYLLEIDTLSKKNERLSLFHALDSVGNPIPTRHHNIQGTNLPDWLTYVRALYMPPEIQFSGQRIIETKNNTVDSTTGITKFTPDQTQIIKQMLVDISIGDGASIAAELQEIRIKKDITPDKFVDRFDYLEQNSRISRFQKAFNNFFKDLQFIGVTNKDPEYPNEYIITFKKNKKSFDIEGLSSGEKQIVYRGAFLMKDSGIERAAIALIDEPEISLHPAWQRKIMEYYSGIMHGEKDSNNQIFVATHSPYVMQGAKNACFFILRNQKMKGQNFQIIITKDRRFDNWTPNQLSLEAFNLEDLYSGDISKKLNKLRKMINEVQLEDRGITDEEYQSLEREIRKIVRSDDAVLLAADLLELRHKIISLKEKK